MAEQVQAVLDQMVAPLKDLMDRGIFSDDEIRAIVSRRRESEYLLRRRVARKADFLRYIEAEMSLEKLRVIRTRQVLARQARSAKQRKNDEQPKGKKTYIGDSHIVAHIHFLFTRMLRKFRSDVSLHLQHAAFAKETKSFTRLGRIYSEALQVHPRNVALWIEAASLEFFGHIDEKGQRVGGGSVQNARVLLQRALRVNSSSQDLWLQYFALELHHLQKLRGRREILQIEGDSTTAEEDNGHTEVNVDDNSLFTQATIATVVFNNAIKAIPDDVTFRLKFLDLLKRFPQTEAVETVIMNSIKEDFHDKPDAWIARANFALERKNEGTNASEAKTDGEVVGFTTGSSLSEINTDDGLPPRKRQRASQGVIEDDVLMVLQEATEQMPTNEMYLKAIQFARSYIEYLGEGEGYSDTEIEEASKSMAEARSFIDQAFVKASDPDADLVLEHADYLVSNDQLEDASSVMNEFLENPSASHGANTLVWVNLARLVEQLESPRAAARVLRKAASRIPIRDGHLTVTLELFSVLLENEPETDNAQEKLQAELHELFQRLLLLSPGDEYRGSQENSLMPERTVADISLAYLHHSHDSGGLSVARKIYTSLFQSSYCQSISGKSQREAHVMDELFKECVSLEKATCKGTAKGKVRAQQKKRLRYIYEVAIPFFQDGEPATADLYRQRLDEDVRFAFN